MNCRDALIVFLMAVPMMTAMAAGDDVNRRQMGSLTLENIPRTAVAEGNNLYSFQSTTGSYEFIGYDLEGRYLYFTRYSDVYKARFKGKIPTLVADTQLSLSGARVARVCDKPGFVFRRDTDGDEYGRIYRYAPGYQEAEQISVGKAQNVALTLNDARDRLAYASSLENSGVWQLVTHRLCDDTQPQVLFSGSEAATPLDWSPDNSQLLVEVPGDTENQLVLVNTENGGTSVLLSSATSFGVAAFSADGKRVFFTAQEWTDNVALFQIDLETGDVGAITASIALDVDGFVLSDDRTTMAVILNQYGFSKLLFLDAVAMKVIPGAPERAPGIIRNAAFSGDNQQFAMSVRHPNSPRRTLVYKLDKRKLEIWTGGFRPGQEMANLATSIILYPTFDEVAGKPRKIPAIMYLPETLPKDGKLPVLIDVHGGPASQARPQHSPTISYYVAKLGMAVIEPNIRGSSGFGKAFEQLDDGLLREDSVKDIGALLDWIEEDGRFDSQRVAISGGSYGGYVVLSALFHYGERIRAGINVVGISDFTTFLENTERNRVDNRRREYGDERDPKMRAFFERISPLENAHRVKSPVLIAHGAQDPRVPLGQAQQIRDELRRQNVPVWYMEAADEGHGFGKDDNAKALAGARSLFLQKYLLDR